MTGKELRTILKALISQVLIDEGGDSLEITTSHQNAPNVDNAYITIIYNPGKSRFGRASKGNVYFNEEDEADLLNGTRLLVSDWVGNVELWETNGDGDRLRKITDALDREDINTTYFAANNISCLRTTDIIQSPRLDNESWVQESSCELVLAIAEGTRETTDYIESVGYEININ